MDARPPAPSLIRHDDAPSTRKGASCIACYGGLMSSCSCEKVSMWAKRTMSRPMSSCMMTYGLCGCTALIIVSADNITLAHYPPPFDPIRNLIEKSDGSAFIMVVTPGTCVQDSAQKWELQANEDWPRRVVVRPYSTNRCDTFGEGMVAVKEVDGIVSITNEFGVFNSLSEWAERTAQRSL